MNGQNQEQVFRGRQQNSAMPGATPTPGMAQGQANPLQNMIAMASKLSSQISGGGRGPGTSLYSYGNSRTNYAEILGLNETVDEEQVKQNALMEASNVATMLFRSAATQAANNPWYVTWKHGVERFKHPRKNLPQDPVLVEFANEVESNQGLRNYILLQSSLQWTGEYAMMLMSGDESVKDRNRIQDIWYRCSYDVMVMQYMHYLSENPSGSQIYYRLSNVTKEVLPGLEESIFENVSARFTFAGAPNPYSKGTLNAMMQRGSVANPILNPANPTDLGMGGAVFDYNPNHYGHYNATTEDQSAQELRNYVAAKVNHNTQYHTPQSEQYYTDPHLPQVSYDYYDRPTLKLDEITRQNRLQYNLNDYAINIPGTEWFIVEEDKIGKLAGALQLDDGNQFRVRDVRVLGAVAIYRFDWQAGTFNYRLVKCEFETWDVMGMLVSNPEKLLPFMYEEDGIQKTTFDPDYLETNKFVREGVFIPMEEMKELKKQPDLIIGSSPLNASQGNEHILNRLNVLTNTYDPKGKTDAFVLPMAVSREFALESSVNMPRFYEQFKLMIPGTEQLTDTGRVIRSLRQSCNDCGSEEFKDFLVPYLTNLVNRWLIECRGYAETKTEASQTKGISYLRTGNIFEDLEDLIQYLKDNDHPTLTAFLDYKANVFMVSGIEIMMNQADTKKSFEEKYKSEEDEITRSVMIKSAEQSILFKRDSVFINLIKATSPYTTDAVIMKESGNPELFAIVRKAIRTASKHFVDTPQVLIKFHKDDHNKVWVATPSEYDPASVLVLRTVSEGQSYVHPYPVCE